MRLIPSYNEVKNRRTKDENVDVWNICTDKVDPKRKDNEDNELDSKNSTNVVPIDNTRIGIIQTTTNISIPNPKQTKEPSTINKCLIERKNAITPEEPTINNNHYMNPADHLSTDFTSNTNPRKNKAFPKPSSHIDLPSTTYNIPVTTETTN